MRDQEKGSEGHSEQVMEIKNFSWSLMELGKVRMGSRRESEGRKLSKILISYKGYNFLICLSLLIFILLLVNL